MARDAPRKTGSPSHAVDCSPESLSEHVVGELDLRSAPRGCAHLAPASASSSSARRPLGDLDRIARVADDDAGLAVDDRLVGAAARAGDLRRRPRPPPRGTRCRSPPVRGRTTDCGTPSRTRRRSRTAAASIVVGTRPRKRTGRAVGAAGHALEPAPVAAGSGDGDREVRVPVDQPRRGLDQHVEPLARHEPAQRRPPARRRRGARTVAGRPCARASVSGRKRSTSTPGGTSTAGRTRPAARSASASAYPPAATTRSAPRSTCRSAARDPGSRPGTVTSAPWSTRPYRWRRRGSDQAERQRRIEQHELGADTRRRARRSVDRATASGAAPVRSCARRGTAGARSQSGAPAYGVVSTATSSGGSRRHSSHRYDWMPPSLGGKSLVTSRCLIRRQAPAPPALRRSPDRTPCGASRSCRPRRRAAQAACERSNGSAVVEVALDECIDRRVTRRRRRCRARRARCAADTRGIRSGDVPAAVAGEQRVVVRRQQLADRHPRVSSGCSVASFTIRGDVRRAHLLAVVAAVDAVAERDAVLDAGSRRSSAAARRGSGGRRRHRAPRSLRSGSRRCSVGTRRSRPPSVRRPAERRRR